MNVESFVDVDTGGKFTAGVVDTGGNLLPLSLVPVANLPPVSSSRVQKGLRMETVEVKMFFLSKEVF